MGQTIVLFYGESQYDVLIYQTDELADCFVKLGFEVARVDLTGESWMQQLQDIIEHRDILFFFGMNGWGVDIRVGEESLYDRLSIPLFCYFVDHPIYHLRRLEQKVSNVIFSFIDETHMRFLYEYYPGSNTRVFVPHAGSSYYGNAPANMKPFHERPISLMFNGTGTNPEHLRQQWNVYGTLVKQWMEEVAECALYNQETPLATVVAQVFEEKKMVLDVTQHKKIWMLTYEIDKYIRAKRRWKVLEGLLNVPLEVYGNGWDFIETTGKKLRIYPAIHFSDTLRLMSDTKIVLNILPNFIKGGHERIFSAMMNGAVCLTDRNVYLDSCFKDEENILFFDFDDPFLGEKIYDRLRDVDRLAAIAEQGQNEAENSHTWMKRAEDIIGIVQFHSSIYRL